MPAAAPSFTMPEDALRSDWVATKLAQPFVENRGLDKGTLDGAVEGRHGPTEEWKTKARLANSVILRGRKPMVARWRAARLTASYRAG